jgi:hypothetical protein
VEGNRVNDFDDVKEKLLKYLETHFLCILKMPSSEWAKILNSSSGGSAFSWAQEHIAFTAFIKRSLCLTYGEDDGEPKFYIGVINSNRSIATTQTRIKIIDNAELPIELSQKLTSKEISRKLTVKFGEGVRSWGQTIHLTYALSKELIELIWEDENCRPILDKLVKKLLHKDEFKNAYSLQVDAIDAVLSVFNYDKNTPAKLVTVEEELEGDHPLHLYEDNVVAHEHRSFMDYKPVYSDATGKAVFEKGNSRLEIFLGNHLPLEELFGVDLIYHNTTNKNTVMVQYKMMEKLKKGGTVYRPDEQLNDEIKRMEAFISKYPPSSDEYRLNSEYFYLKFVPRDGKLSEQTFLMPLSHYKVWINSPKAKSDKGAVRITFDALNGSYMRSGAFNDLLRSGYIGSYRKTTEHLQKMVEETIKNGKAYVVAIQSYMEKKEIK